MANFTWLYVGVLYAIAVGRVEIPKRVALLFYVLVLAFLFRPLTQEVVIVPADVIRLTPPWSEVRAPGRAPVTKYEVSNLNLHDVPMQIVPWLHQVRESWRAGEAPLWNAAAGCGYPLLANGQSTPLSPLQLLTLPLPLRYAITADAAMKLLLALVLTYLFCATRYSRTASVIAAIAYGFSTWMTTWLQFPIATAAAFLPGVLFVIDRLIDGWTRQRFIAASLMFAATVLSGHPETVFHVGLIAAAYGVWVAGFRRALLRVLAACIVAALLASPFLVPFAEAVVRSQRFAEVSATGGSVEPPYSDFHSAILLLQPRFFGQLPIERPWGPTTLESICGFAGVLSLVAIVAAAVYIVMRRRWRDRETLYVLGAVLCVGIVLGWPVITQGFAAIAGLAPAMRMRLGICWFGSVLIAAVIDWTRRDTRVPLFLATAAVGATMLWLLRTVAFPTESHRVSAVLSLLPSVAVLAALLIPRVRFHAAGVLTIVELWLAIGHWNPVLPMREWYPRTPLIAGLEKLNGARMVGIGGQVYPNTGAMFGLEDVRVHDPMADARYVDFLTQTIGWDPKDYYAKWNDAETPLLDFLNVKYVVTADGRIKENRDVLPRFFAVRNVIVSDDLRNHTDWKYTAVVRRVPDPALTQPWTTADATVAITRASTDRYSLRIRAPRTTLIVSSIPRWPGWRAGKFRTLDVNGPFLGFVVPAGEHVVEVAYRPLSFYVPAVIAVMTLIALLTAFARAPAPSRTPPANPPR